MEGLNLISTFAEFKELKNIDRPTMMSVLEDVFRNQLIKMYGTADNFDIIINIDKGDFEIWRNREVVEVVEDPTSQISLEEVSKIDDSLQVGELYPEEVRLSAFGRRGILNLRQNLSGRIMDIEKANLYNTYKERVGEVVVGEVYQVWKKEVLVMDEEGNELLLPKTEQIPSDFFRKGDSVRAVVARVDLKNNNPVIVLSRTANEFLERLFEQEVPEIFDGLITIKKIVRIPGEWAKVAVESYDERSDPVGACVGVKGSRIHGIVKELRNENIDIINWTSNMQLLIQRALSPAKITSVKIHDDIKGDYYVYVEENWTHTKIANSINVIEHEERLKDYIDKRFDELQSSIENAKSSADSIDDAVCSIKSSIEKIEKDGVGSGKGISEKTLLSAIEIVSKQK